MTQTRYILFYIVFNNTIYTSKVLLFRLLILYVWLLACWCVSMLLPGPDPSLAFYMCLCIHRHDLVCECDFLAG